MAAALEVNQAHHGDEISNVKARCRRVESAVSGDHSAGEGVLQPLRVLREKTAPTQFVEQWWRVRRHGTKTRRGWY